MAEAEPVLTVYVVSGVCSRSWRELELYLSPEERQAVLRFRREEDRSRFVFGRVLFRSLLSRELGVPPAQVWIEISSVGKPFAAGTGLHGSISHSGDFVACVVTRNIAVGVDIECWSSARLMDSLAGLFCSGSELGSAARAAASRRNIELLRLWTLKEAYGKMLGTGIGELLAHEFVLGQDGGAVLKRMPPDEALQFETIVEEGRHVLAVALRGRQAVTVREINSSLIGREPASGWLAAPRRGSRPEFSC